MIWDWLREKLGLDTERKALRDALEAQGRYCAMLHQWCQNLDAALCRVEKHVMQATAAPEPPDLKRLAERIRGEMMAVKAPFPTRAEDVKG